jgi:hypothetical protein
MKAHWTSLESGFGEFISNGEATERLNSPIPSTQSCIVSHNEQKTRGNLNTCFQHCRYVATYVHRHSRSFLTDLLLLHFMHHYNSCILRNSKTLVRDFLPMFMTIHLASSRSIKFAVYTQVTKLASPRSFRSEQS